MQVTLFKPHIKQKEIIDSFVDTNHKYGIVATGRQFGKSLLGQNLLLYWLLANPNQKAGWIAPIYGQCRKVFKELANAAHGVILEKNKAELTITFINGSTLISLSADRPDSIRGYSFNYIVIDEAAFIKEQALTEAILPTMTAIGKKALVISTPKGKTWFYNWWLKGQDENKDFISFTGLSTDNPYTDKEFIAQQQLSLPKDIYEQEYNAKFSDAGSEVFRGLDNVCELNNFVKRDKIKISKDEDSSVNKCAKITDTYYNELFKNSIVYLDLYASTCNNVILECIKTNCPIVINRLPPVEAYLGKEYPLFFDNVNDINKDFINDDKIITAHKYLQNLDKSRFTVDYFISYINKQLSKLSE